MNIGRSVPKQPAPGSDQALESLLRNSSEAALRNVLLKWSLQDVAGALTRLPPADQAAVLHALPLRAASAVFEYLPTSAQNALIRAMGKDDVAAILNVMADDDRTLFLSELPAHASSELLTLLDSQERAAAERLLAHPEHSVGRLMTPDYVAIGTTWTMTRVLEHIRAYGHDSETLDVLYVVDAQGVLIDDIRMREVLLVPPETRVRDLMNERFTALRASDDQQAAVEVFRRDDRTALPVIDEQGKLIGIVTIDDVLDVAQRLATRAMQRFGGAMAIDDAYLTVPVGQMIRKRAGWLVVLFLGEMLTATAMGFFEDEIARAVVLAMFIPLIISSGGNSGSQASTLIIRALAVGDLSLGDWWRVARREVVSGVSLGAILGAIGALRVAAWSAFTNLYGPHWPLVALVIGLTLVGVVLWGALIGAMLPFVLRRAGFDPATSSAPLVATLVDVTGLVIYFSIAVVVLRGSLL
jgi:magnesium transporter